MAKLYYFTDDEMYCHHTLDDVPNPAEFSMHAHDQLEIFYFISGNGSYLVEGTNYVLSPHDILIMRQAETHKPMISPDAPYERIAIHFSPELLRAFPSGLLVPFYDRPLGRGNLFSGTKYPKLCSAFQDFDFSGSHLPHSHIFARLLLFLSQLADVYESEHRDAIGHDDSSELVSYVNDHLFENLCLSSISAHFLKSTAQISRDFKKATGSTIWDYIRIKRLLAAQALIQRGDAPTKVCSVCGFSDYSAFFRAYKAHFGCPPSQNPRKKAASAPDRSE